MACEATAQFMHIFHLYIHATRHWAVKSKLRQLQAPATNINHWKQ